MLETIKIETLRKDAERKIRVYEEQKVIFEVIKDTFKKFDGKQVNKRLATSLKNELVKVDEKYLVSYRKDSTDWYEFYIWNSKDGAAIENLVVNAGEYTDNEYRNLKSEFEAYESMLDSCHSVCYEVLNIMEEYEKKLNELYDYVSYAKRINRDKITGVLAEIDLDKISNSIAQTI